MEGSALDLRLDVGLDRVRRIPEGREVPQERRDRAHGQGVGVQHRERPLAVVNPSQSLDRDRHRRCPFVLDTSSVTVNYGHFEAPRRTSFSSETLLGGP